MERQISLRLIFALEHQSFVDFIPVREVRVLVLEILAECERFYEFLNASGDCTNVLIDLETLEFFCDRLEVVLEKLLDSLFSFLYDRCFVVFSVWVKKIFLATSSESF